MAKYRFILFDADNTLFDFYRAEEAALCDALRDIGFRTDPEVIATYSRINDGMWKMLERGEITKAELRTRRFVDFCHHFGIDEQAQTLARTYPAHLAEKSFLMPDALEICEALASDVALYIVTNGISSVQRGRFAPSPLRPLFSDLFISEELGFEKPRREFFEAVAARIPDFDPKHALIVGDSLSSDIAGGIAYGIDTCWLNHNGVSAPEGMHITYTVRELREVLPLVLGV